MRIFLVAGAVAVAVLVAVVVVGLRLTGDDEPEWSGQATAACEQALGRGRQLATAGAAITPVERRVVEVFAGAAEIEADMLAELEALPRPSADEQAIARTLAVVAESHQDDLALLANAAPELRPAALRAPCQRDDPDPGRPACALHRARRDRLRQLLRPELVRHGLISSDAASRRGG